MVYEVFAALYKTLQMRWKASSLGVMFAETVNREDKNIIEIQDLEMGIINFKRV